ncbi:MAG: TPMT family class I SAM-dependent methyltransferase [Fibromonadales bacterium]|nr:TPMT family class I SAM-dependent methyltransferase [Fibromonadales bacterium]MCL2208206.1 TPMT family class I SAM-dependent methyltransferase [Fibromonadales bacterium]
MIKMALTPNVPQYWEMLYEGGKDIWDLGEATPALLDFFKHPSCPETGEVFVPAAGKGWDAGAWAERGHNVVAVDFCSSAFDALERLSASNSNLKALNKDIFLLNSRNLKQFDIIYDYFAFNSVHPGRRDEYVEMWLRMLKDDGFLIGFFCPLSSEKYGECPPYSISGKELEARLKDIFEIKQRIVPKKSAKDRTGKEEIWLLRKVV